MGFRFSVITPSYRQGQFIERTIQSVLRQEFPDMEYLICDGGSDDDTVEILKRYRDELAAKPGAPSFHWISEPDAGQADAVNKGIARTSGDIIAWINSDDLYYPGAFQAVAAVFEAHPDIDILYGDADIIDEQDRRTQSFPTEPWNYERLQSICYLCQPSVFFRRRLVERLGGLNASLNYCMDYELWLRYGQQVPFYYLPQRLAASRMYVGNKTWGQRLKAQREIIKMLKRRLNCVPSPWVLEYALTKAEKTTKLSRDRARDARQLTTVLVAITFAESNRLQQSVPPIVLLKMLIWWLFPNLAWFRRSATG